LVRTPAGPDSRPYRPTCEHHTHGPVRQTAGQLPGYDSMNTEALSDRSPWGADLEGHGPTAPPLVRQCSRVVRGAERVHDGFRLSSSPYAFSEDWSTVVDIPRADWAGGAPPPRLASLATERIPQTDGSLRRLDRHHGTQKTRGSHVLPAPSVQCNGLFSN
jgi:hypothetical protein